MTRSPLRRRPAGPLATATLLAALGAGVLGGACTASGQGSVVAPAPGGALRVDGAPLYPLGWVGVGQCLDPERPGFDPFAVRRDTLAAQLDRLRAAGVNALIEPPQVNGRTIAHAASAAVGNWYGYTYTDADGARRSAGHPRPGAYVEALGALMDLAYARGERPIYTLVDLAAFVTPGYAGTPHGGGDRLTCRAYRDFIGAERAAHAEGAPERAARIPAPPCADADVRPFWEWNLWYVVTALREHPGLLGWYLWDEPEGFTHRHLFGLVAPGAAVPAYAGPESLPTPDLLYHAYDLVRASETAARPDGAPRHPVVVDVAYPPAFFSTERFAWAKPGAPEWDSGPFDRRPGGGHGVPADLLGLETSAFWVHTAARGGAPRQDWYWDPNLVSRRSAEVAEAVARYDLWGGLVVAAQAQLPDAGPYRVEGPFPCRSGYSSSARLLNDRDLVWNLLTPQINGLRGALYYSHSLMPLAGPGAEQRRRTDRLLRQFAEAGLDDALRAPAHADDRLVRALTVEALTNYYRSDPAFVGPADGFDPGRSRFSAAYRLDDPADYNALQFGRSEDAAGFGHAIRAEQYRPEFPTHRLLRAALHRHDGAYYLFLSNAYDARVTAEVALPVDARAVAEGRFDLDAGGAFRWAPLPGRADARGRVVAVGLEPYEVRIFRVPAAAPPPR